MMIFDHQMMKSDFNVFTGRMCKIIVDYFVNLFQSRNLIIKVIDCLALQGKMLPHLNYHLIYIMRHPWI